ncbi:MAG: transglycosylase SLT domain-containing protein [Gammaproteobacteria bacterium]|nr:transglycosylase SLT domain-containing protein [Gammaproteobacteria bacterium]
MTPIPSLYDSLIKAAVAKHAPGLDWRWIKAQCWQESHFDVDAKSPVGARGIAQFMPATWAEECKLLGYGLSADPCDPELAIPACAHYMSRLRFAWRSAAASSADLQALALASYNAGSGNIYRASRIAFPIWKMVTWDAVASELHKVTGDDDAPETLDYIAKVHSYYRQICAAESITPESVLSPADQPGSNGAAAVPRQQ